MAQSMKENGNLISLMGLEYLSMLMATVTKEIGSTAKLMAEGCIHIRMVPFITGSGRMTCKMGKASRSGQMAHSMRVSTQKVKKVEKENL